ncbi:MAG TPA: hypothetical protein VME46_14190 [Acidimicrobiales bacterium]|nr:hypothetical protein [Acidimicrobiales bacterium]
MRYLRWRRARLLVPVAVSGAIGVAALTPTLSGAAAPPTLPSITPDELLASVLQAKTPAMSGTLTWTANLGLSDISTLENELGGNGNGGGAGSGFDPISLLTGSYQIQAWLAPDAEHLSLAETSDQELDVIRNANQLWIWDSSSDSVTHLVAPAKTSGATAPSAASTSTSLPLTPGQVADRILSHVSRFAAVTTGSSLYVAGVPAYQLLVAPLNAPGSTVNHLEIDVAASGALQGTVLQVAVYANGTAAAALQLGFTGQINVGEPPASELTFTPPPGAEVTTHVLSGSGLQRLAHRAHPGAAGSPQMSVLGQGWTAVVSGTAQSLSTNPELQGLTSVVPVGGQSARLFSTDLLNVLIMPDGTFYAGFVSPEVLEADASSAVAQG